jgi:hypothetical protein
MRVVVIIQHYYDPSTRKIGKKRQRPAIPCNNLQIPAKTCKNRQKGRQEDRQKQLPSPLVSPAPLPKAAKPRRGIDRGGRLS